MSETDGREAILGRLAAHIEKAQAGIVVGWDLRLAAGPPEEDAIVVEAFDVPEDQELDLLKLVLPEVRRAQERLGRTVLLVTHDPQATRTYYLDAVRRLEAQRARPLPAEPGRLADRPAS